LKLLHSLYFNDVTHHVSGRGSFTTYVHVCFD